MVHIYTDEETTLLIGELRKKDPNINFSQIYKLAIFKEANKEPVKDIEYLKTKLEELRNQKEHILADIKILENKIDEIQEEQAERQKQKELAQKKEAEAEEKREEKLKIVRDLRREYEKWCSLNPNIWRQNPFEDWAAERAPGVDIYVN